jgi:signal transduction histidine kinase
MPLTGNVRVKTVYLTVFLLLLTSYLLIFYSLREFSKQSGWVQHSDQVIYNIQTLLSHLNQAESGARGYLILREDEQLENFYSNTKQIDSLIKSIETLTADNPEQQKNADSLKLLVQERLGRLYRTVLLVKDEKDVPPGNIKSRIDFGNKLMNDINFAIQKMENKERTLLDQRSKRLEKVFTSIRVVTITSLAIALLLFIYSFFIYSRESKRKDQAGVQVDAYKDQLEKKITELQQANKELLELRSIEKFAASGRIARTIAHEIRNPLTNIALASEQIKTMVEGNEEVAMLLDMVNRNSNRINQMISELLTSTKFAQLDFSKVDINQVLDDTLELASDRIELKQITVIKNYTGPGCSVMIDIQKMKIAFLNIIMNAIEAMEKGQGVLEIATKKQADKCIIEFTDNGSGMNEDTLHRIFEPYFTNKTKGAGLGLTNTQNIILNHKGNIEVTSTAGKGTVFTVSLLLENPVFPAQL